MLKKTVSLLLLFCLSAAFISAQEDDALRVYKIRKIDFNVSGKRGTGYSRPFALLNNGKLAEGDEMTGRENLEAYIRDRTQRLVNLRMFENDVRIDYTLDEAGEDGKVPVDLLVTLRDGGSIIVFPMPSYSTSDGFDITLKYRDSNFLGFMAPFKVDFGYALNTKNESSFNVLIDTDIPFKALGFNWNVNFDNEFNYFLEEPLTYKNTTGLSMELPFKRTTFTFGTEHYINVNVKNNDRNVDRGFGKYFDGVFNSVEISAAWEIPTSINVGRYGELTYTPKISEEIVYNPGGQDEHEFLNLRRGPFTKLEQEFGFNRVDWKGNFREGLDVSFKNTNIFNHNQNVWNIDYSLNETGHFILTDFLGISERFELRQWFYNYPDKVAYNLGDRLRGVRDDEVEGSLMLSLNVELPVHIFTVSVFDWFKSPKIKPLNLDLFLAPFFDMGMVYLPDELNTRKTGQDVVNMYYTGGAELLVFFEFSHSHYLRVNFGVDIGGTVKTGEFKYEISAGLGHFF
ncbi:hypothetical protein FACS189442_2080 [Spirochaetia bacterium]|nr:hypothetical protein FACS189442_2080 [Spirochaetia bacterium]